MASQDGPLGAGEFPEFDVNHENQGCEIHIGPNDSSTARVNAELPSKALGGKLYTVPQLPIEMFENIGAGAPGTIRSISSVHPQCVSPCVDPFGVAGCKKSSPWWMCFSVFDRNKPVAIHINSDPTNAQCCNLCGLQVNGNKEGSSTPLKRHIQRKHPDVFAMLVESFGATLPGHIHAKGNSKRLSSQSKRKFAALLARPWMLTK